MKRRGQCGAGLIELAVAILVLSIGTLGLARGQLAARQAASESLQRSEAVLLGSGLLEQVRANPAALAAYSLGAVDEIAIPDRDCAQASCTAIQWGAWSRWQWLQAVSGSAARDDNGVAIAGLMAPLACLSTGPDATVVQLYWRITPSPRKHSCGEPPSRAEVRVLSLAMRNEVPLP